MARLRATVAGSTFLLVVLLGLGAFFVERPLDGAWATSRRPSGSPLGAAAESWEERLRGPLRAVFSLCAGTALLTGASTLLLLGRLRRDLDHGALELGAEMGMRQIAERRLIESLAAWRETFDRIDAVIVVVGRDLRLLRINETGRTLLDAPFAALLGMPLAALADAEPWRTAVRLLANRTGETATTEQIRDSATGRVWLVVVNPASANPGGGHVFVARDVTEMSQLQESLHRSEIWAKLGQLVGGVAHEVRNPLFVMTAALESLRGDPAAQAFADELRVLECQARRLDAFMRDLLEYGKPARGLRSERPFSEVVSGAFADCLGLAHHGRVTLHSEIAADLPVLSLVVPRMVTALANLVRNAIQHSPAGAEVRVEVAAYAAGRALVCTVDDAGPGIPAALRREIFEPFASGRSGGTGLGLAIAKRIVEEEHGGRLSADDRPGGGSRFTVSLPLQAAET